ncbi:MAG: aminodeoxychorismate/anthranilate synthase component II [Deltaproteobacteria bacterium]|jgi:anthranilate synthase component 2|nr:aminodeoxychorismate/anthranilate synthase component II [Deltaproteobacteria bacterium]
MRVLLLDCHDSFTRNLAQIVSRLLGPEDALDIVLNDELRLSSVSGYHRILLSPGPGVPDETPNLLELIRESFQATPILGVCLGHQALARAFGGGLRNLDRVFHGIGSPIKILKREGIFSGLPEEITGGRYHSWVADERDWPEELEVTARDGSGMVMALSHKRLPVFGVQFHPESILTPEGPRIVENFLRG